MTVRATRRLVRSLVPAAATVALTLQAGPSTSLASAPQVARFTDVTASSGIQVQGLGNASSWIDYNGDGLLDLFATNSDFPGRVWLYRNTGSGTFTDVTAQAGFSGITIRSVAWGDYDNDGWPDLAATTYMSNSQTRLYHNNGDGTFTNVGGQAGMKKATIPWRVSWADYDRDGLLDLYQANSGGDFLYRNNGDGTFNDVAQTAGVSGPEFSNDGAWGDYDGDGWPDLFVADDGADHLYRNNGDGTFVDDAAVAGVSDPAESQSACWGDYDANGRLDLYVVDISAASNHLYRNDGDGTFTDVTVPARVGDVGDGRTCNWVDFDNDGRLDLFATNHVHVNRLFRNNGNGTFTDVARSTGIANPFDVFNGAWGDYDLDGDLDLFVVGHAGNVLYRNDGPTGSYLHLELIGTASNRSAVGAVASIVLPNRVPNRQVEGASGAYGQDSLTLEFGVGRSPGPFTVRVAWPSGVVQTLTGVQPNSRLVVVEP